MHIVWHGLRPFASGVVPLRRLAQNAGALVRPYYSDLFEIFVGIEVEIDIEISLKGGEQFEGLEVESFHVFFFGMYVVWHPCGQKSRGLGHLLHWFTRPGAVVRVYYH